MAPGKKKKKPASNPARGFATVSLPSKAKIDTSASQGEGTKVEEVGNIGSKLDAPKPQTNHGEVVGENGNAAITDMTPEQFEAHLEDAELQSLIDAHSAHCKAEVARQTARLETERRTLRLNANKLSSSFWLPEDLLGDIFDAHNYDSEIKVRQIPLHTAYKDSTDLMLKSWSLRRLLLSIDLPNVDEALKHVLQIAFAQQLQSEKDYLWGLGEALEWYAIRTDSAELPKYDVDLAEVNPRSRAANTSGEHSSTTTRSQSPVIIQNLSPAITSRPGSPITEDTVSTIEMEPNVIEDGVDLDAASDGNSDDDNDPSQLVNRWVQIQISLLSIEHLESHDDQGIAKRKSRVQVLQKRLAAIESDILFDKYEGELAWREALPQAFANIQAQKARLDFNTRIAAPTSSPPLTGHGSSENSKQPENSQQQSSGGREPPGEEELGISSADQTENDDIFGDIFTAPETYQSSRDTATKQSAERVIQLIDFGKAPGVSPRRILEETCKIRDKNSRIHLSLLTKSAHSNRHKLVIRWSLPQTHDPWLSSTIPEAVSSRLSPFTTELEMQSIATPNSLQSEAYISTIALFALSLNVPGQQKMSLRLPPIWRDVWQDLTNARRDAINHAEKSDLKHVRNLIIEVSPGNDIVKKAVIRPKDTALQSVDLVDDRHTADPNTSLNAEQICADWAMKISTPSFRYMMKQRSQLPIWAHRHEILETVQSNSITILSAETGAGKSTQVPSFILENEWCSGRDCRILVTQPRRISAITLARRVSQELGEGVNDVGSRRSLVGYSIRLESKVSQSTRITFATTGVLLRMLESTPNLDDLNYLILDEVHERTMDLDLLFIGVRHLRHRRPDLKVILMSATVDSQKFAAYFGDAPVLSISGRTFPVEIGYLEEALQAVGEHAGAIIDPQEVTEDDILSDMEPRNSVQKTSTTITPLVNFYEYRIDYDLIVKLISTIAFKPQYVKYSKAILVFLPGIAEIRRLNSAINSDPAFSDGWVIHMLHSSFSSEDLERAFAIPPGGIRKIVIATNIAETGITIPDITAVIDSCKEKIMRFDDRRQLSKLTEGFISRASSRQRRGRAARVQDGLCFHLVTKARYDNLMLEQQVPEMLRLSLQDAVLRIKIWNLGPIEETLKQAIDAPTPKNVRRAIEALKDAGALTSSEDLTSLGRQVARLPLDVSLSKLAILGIALQCLDAAISITAILSSKSPFLVSPHQKNDQGAAAAKAIFSRSDSDLLTIYSAYQAWQKASATSSSHTFCRKHSLSAQVLSQIEEQKVQLLVQLVDAGLLIFTSEETSTLRQARISSRRQTATFFTIPSRYNSAGSSDTAICSSIAAAFYPKLLIRQGKGWRNVSTNQQVSLAPNSINRLTSKPSKWLSFYEAMQTRSGHLNASETTAVPESAILLLLGEADFKLFAGVVSIDGGRIRFATRHWRTIMALKILRAKMKGILERFFRNAGRQMTEADQRWFGFWLRVVQAGRAEVVLS